jgi:Z1 domain
MEDADAGSARIVDEPAVAMTGDGPCLGETLETLSTAPGPSVTPSDLRTKLERDALGLLEDVLQTYERDVARGEVGRGGTGRASEEPPILGKCPTGLLYGRVQSGKTAAMIAFSAAALDNGFRVILILTSDFVKLVEQTAKRFAVLSSGLSGPLVRDSGSIDTWLRDADHIRKQIGAHGLIVVCAKNQAHLRTLYEFLETIDAASYPALILDDEADQATLDTTVAARATQRPTAPAHSSTIHRRAVRNDAPWEEGESLRELLRHHVFIQVTATPYALLLQNFDNPLRPAFTRLLEPGDGYTGGESFFDTDNLEQDGRPPLVFVDENESQQIAAGTGETPPGLTRAISFFLVAAGAQYLSDAGIRSQGQNFLCHTSHRTADHEALADLIRKRLSQIDDDLKAGAGVPPGETGALLQWAYAELQKTLPGAPSLEAALDVVRRRLPRRQIPIVNSANDKVDFGRELNFIVGGNILGRGLTIENLLVTYYLRRAKVSQMDTVLQHARMFGYRARLMPFTRVFLSESLGFRFHQIHKSELSLRGQLATGRARGRIAVETVVGLRATRPNVLDINSLSAYGPGEQVYPTALALDHASLAKNPRVEESLRAAFGGSLKADVFVEVPIETVIRLVKLVPYSEEFPGNWDPDMLERVLSAISERYSNRGSLHYRQMTRTKPRLLTGAASGDEVAEAAALGRPALLLFRDTGRHVGSECWYPTLVFPGNMNTQVFNVT